MLPDAELVDVPSTYIPIGLYIENVVVCEVILLIARSTSVVSVESYATMSSLVLSVHWPTISEFIRPNDSTFSA